MPLGGVQLKYREEATEAARAETKPPGTRPCARTVAADHPTCLPPAAVFAFSWRTENGPFPRVHLAGAFVTKTT